MDEFYVKQMIVLDISFGRWIADKHFKLTLSALIICQDMEKNKKSLW
jgi:hypothetical protein